VNKTFKTGNSRVKFSEHIKNMSKSPIMIGLFLGILISMVGIGGRFESHPVTSALISALTMISNTTVPIILLVIGYELHFDFKRFIEPISAVILRILLMLFLAYLLNTFIVEKLLDLDEMYKMAVYTMFVLPPTFVIPVFIEGECEEKSFVLNFLSIHVILSLIAFILLLMLIR
jgi:predicted permease